MDRLCSQPSIRLLILCTVRALEKLERGGLGLRKLDVGLGHQHCGGRYRAAGASAGESDLFPSPGSNPRGNKSEQVQLDFPAGHRVLALADLLQEDQELVPLALVEKLNVRRGQRGAPGQPRVLVAGS